jgi:hypothetical protein
MIIFNGIRCHILQTSILSLTAYKAQILKVYIKK